MRIGARVFLRPPHPGQTKTRLEPALGAAGAAALYRRLLAHTLAVLARAPVDGVTLDVAGAADDPVLLDALPAPARAWPRMAQPAGDLGARLLAAAAAGLGSADAVLLLGTDCPVLAVQHLTAVGAALQRAPVVLLPALDGGYVGLGLTRAARPALPALFSDMPWSTAMVAAETTRRAAAAGLGVWRTAPLWDVDEPADLARLAALGWDLPGA